MHAVRIVLWAAVALALFGLGALVVSQRFGPAETAATGGMSAPGAPLGGPFALVDDTGETVTEDIFRGKPSVTLFGFTHCPDICPTGLLQMSQWMNELGDDADKLRFIFVTVDPERDTVEMMHDYIGAFSENIIGITGPPDAVRAMAGDYKIYFRKVPLDGGDYTMDHTASMILQDADGNFVGTIAHGESSDVGLGKLKRLVAG